MKARLPTFPSRLFSTAPAALSFPGRRSQAYTLIEVLIVVVILGIAAAIVVPAMLQPGTLSIQAAARMVISDLLYAQNEAIAAQAPHRVVFEPQLNRYRLTDASGQTIQSSWKGGTYLVDLNRDSRFRGVRLVAADFDGSGTVEFDALGSPSTGGWIDLEAGPVRYRISVAPITGRVSLQQVAQP